MLIETSRNLVNLAFPGRFTFSTFVPLAIQAISFPKLVGIVGILSFYPFILSYDLNTSQIRKQRQQRPQMETGQIWTRAFSLLNGNRKRLEIIILGYGTGKIACCFSIRLWFPYDDSHMTFHVHN